MFVPKRKLSQDRAPRQMTELYEELSRACDRVLAQIKANPTGVTGHLLGGIDRERMEKVAREWEMEYVGRTHKETLTELNFRLRRLGLEEMNHV